MVALVNEQLRTLKIVSDCKDICGLHARISRLFVTDTFCGLLVFARSGRQKGFRRLSPIYFQAFVSRHCRSD